VLLTTQTVLTDLDSDATRLETGHHLVTSPAGPLPALSNRQLVELHMHDDVPCVVDLDRLQQRSYRAQRWDLVSDHSGLPIPSHTIS